MNDKLHVIKWFGGVTHVRRVVKRDGLSLMVGCQIDDGPFQPFIKLTFTDPKEQTMMERELRG